MTLRINLFVPLALVCLSGCASYVADEITRPKEMSSVDMFSGFANITALCGETGECINAIELAHPVDTPTFSLSFDGKVNNNHKIWRYEFRDSGDDDAKEADNNLIVLFPGYGHSENILFFLQKWLHFTTGAKVYVIQSANRAEHFQFGLDSVSPIVSLINREQPKNVKLIGFSMGAVAAHAVARRVGNAELHLVAPMTNFEQSTLGIWDFLARDSLYRFFVSQETLKDAVGLVHERAQFSAQDIDITRAAPSSSTPAHIYISSSDSVTPAQNWQGIESNAWQFHEYAGLNHLEMVTLLQKDLFLTFAANLLGKEPDAADIATFGLICDANDEACMSQEL
ncbi:hypothetical protein [Pseudoalteromonas sp. GB56]